MNVILILLVIIFAVALCIIEIPKMLAAKATKDLWSFSIILALGVILAISNALNIPLSNPSDWVAWIYSPVSNMLRHVLE